ncbi:hypothetical protein B0H16DRAFT_436717 [Mycena metata]|uniref:Uncharacterized protein n=1 Tax=Mycena metata TaxID=1033252 RepID=A0AAD7HD56_9AGAR|nr:hypothetical protein B0H16DRAFT_436717 [Mycena metata]
MRIFLCPHFFSFRRIHTMPPPYASWDGASEADETPATPSSSKSGLRQVLRRLSPFHKSPSRPPPRVDGVSESAATSERENEEEIPITVNSSNGAATTRNVLKFSLSTLSTISANIPFGSGLSAVIEPLLTIVDRIEQMSSNAQGLVELAARIELLAPVVSEMAENPGGSKIIERLQRELESITTDLEAARTHGKLNQFFNSDDNSSSLQKHNMTLAQLIADSTMVTVHEVLKSVQEFQQSRFEFDTEPTFELGDITGGFGGAGSSGLRIGGQGGDGEGPTIDMDPEYRWKMGDVSGGTGGPGGDGAEIGGQGGVGRGPIISISRRKLALV